MPDRVLDGRAYAGFPHNPYKFRAFQNTTLGDLSPGSGIGNTGLLVCPYDTVDYDLSQTSVGQYNPSTSTFTAAVSGIYVFSASFSCQARTTPSVLLYGNFYIYKPGTSKKSGPGNSMAYMNPSSGAIAWTMNFIAAATFRLDAGETVQANFSFDDGTGAKNLSNAILNAGGVFTGHRLSD